MKMNLVSRQSLIKQKKVYLITSLHTRGVLLASTAVPRFRVTK